MKAAWYHKNGPAEETLIVGDQPDPIPGAGQVLVKMMTSGVNPSDVKSRLSRPLNAPLIIPHSDGAGVIEAVGEGVDAARVGERVWLWNAQWGRSSGSASERVAIDQAQAVRLPKHVSFEQGACFGIPLLTALQALRLCGDVKGKTVLVTGAASSVGHYAAQLAVLGGARVIGTVGSDQKSEHAKSIGVSECINYKLESVPERIKDLTGAQGVDVIIDMDFSGTNQWLSKSVLRSHGLLVCYGSNVPSDVSINFRPLLFHSLTLKFFLIYDVSPADRQIILSQATQLLESSALKHTVAKVFPLEHIVQAHQAVEQGLFTGNVVLSLG
jgi:NADPH2:quinone reductase